MSSKENAEEVVNTGEWSGLTSTFTLIACFISTYIFYQFMVASFASALDFDVKLTFNEVFLPMNPRIWDRIKVTEVNLIPLAICFFIGFTIFWIIKLKKEQLGKHQLLLMWLMVCLFNIPMSQLLFAPFGVDDSFSIFYFGLARVATWYYITFPLQLMISFVGLILLMFSGLYICKTVVGFSHSFSLVEKNSGKNQMIVRMYVIPVFLAAPPLLLLGKDLSTIRLGIMLGGLLIPSIGMFSRNARAIYQVNFKKTGIGDKFPIREMVASLVLWLVVFIWLR